jgi:hypothetical protein
VIPFRRRDRSAPVATAPERAAPLRDPPGLQRYEGGDHDDYRHRMLVNVAALVFTIALAAAGVWLAVKLSDLRQAQDCLASGRRNCAPIDINALVR